ncbi:hypothetical protein EDB83DRAFT_2422333, partial [Lactarius deliciosus]
MVLAAADALLPHTTTIISLLMETSTPLADIDSDVLRSVVEHVFMPPMLPQVGQDEKAERESNVAICHVLIDAARSFLQVLPYSQRPQWGHMIKMMESVHRAAEFPFETTKLQHTLSNMTIGDVFVMHIRAQNAAVIVRRLAPHQLLLQPPSADTFTNESFLRELSSFLVQMDVDILDSAPTTRKAGSVVHEVRESAHPRYISELLVGILRAFGQAAVVDRITKRIGDEVLWDDAYTPWRRSPLWLILRISLQTSLRVSNTYKTFMLFFHSFLLRNSLSRNFSSELLYAMRAKIARRLSKLRLAVSHHIYDFIYNTARVTEAHLQRRWTDFQALTSLSPPWLPETLDPTADSTISLTISYSHLEKMLNLTSCIPSRTQFSPSDTPRLNNTRDFKQFTEGRLANAIAKDRRIALADFEVSVEKHLGSWATASLHNDGALEAIASCIEQYLSGAKGHYGTNAEDNSVMILTILDLWVAMDTITIQLCPLLKQYSPEIPARFLHPLLLRRSDSIKRALFIEEYLSRRYEEALNVTPIFSNSASESSFSAQYFCSSGKRAEKRAELATLNQQARSLSKEASTLDHEQIKDTFGNEIHSGVCKKCDLERRSKTIKIQAHDKQYSNCPHRLRSLSWRDTTYLILRDLGMSEVPDSPDQPKLLLEAFSGLNRWVTRSRSRITIGSTTKSFFDNTHYKTVGIPAEESSVLLNNGLSLKLFDRSRNVESLCTPPVPISSAYAPLHFAVPIASQVDCPKEISIHDGPRLQWLNIARELASPALSFRREEVHVLITQAVCQLGPLSDGIRDWHVDLGIPNFGRTLLRELDSLIEKIRANWLEEVTVRTIALICSRLIASATDSEVCEGACALLRKARDLTARLESTQGELSREGLRRRLCMLAVTCFSTFDVSPEYIPAIFSSCNDLSIAMQCAIIVHDNTPSSLADDNTFYLTRMLHRHSRLLHLLEPVFSFHNVPANPSFSLADGYDHAVASFWPGYRRSESSRWCAVPKPQSRWTSCVAEGGQKIHYNLLTGQLLVDGKPLGKLPQEIIEHPMYADILGARVLDVVPADVPGMESMTRSTVSGYQILFSRGNGDITLKARQPGGSQLFQLVPRILSTNYIHWLDLSTGEVEFRPAGSPWTPNPSNWRLYFLHHAARSHLMLRKRTPTVPSEELVDIRSATFGMKLLEVSLPRLHLSFFVNQISELECRSIPGYVVDETQSIGTMFGLKNRLVLCPSRASPEGCLLPRRVIIPQGDIAFTQHGDFASVSIDTGADKYVRWYEYIIDTNLRCLTSNSGLSGKLYACYLHALTSHCLPDPLLGHTGTEEALDTLRGAACRSVYYPRHLQSMVTVVWNNLPALSQHHNFYTAVCSILDHARALEALYDKPTVFEIPSRNQLLLDRVASRNDVFYPQDLQSSGQQSPCKDQLTWHIVLSWSIWNSKLSLDRRPDLWGVLNSGGLLGPASTVVPLRYSRYWLEFDATQDWLMIYDLCHKATSDTDPQDLRIQLSFCLSAASFSNLTHLRDLISDCALPIHLTPAISLQVQATKKKKIDKRRKIEYEGAVKRESLVAAQEILSHWPNYQSVDISAQWFDKSDCHQQFAKYLRSISRNIQFRDHIQQLQGILQHYYENHPDVPTVASYTFSPCFTASPPTASSCLIRDVLAFRTPSSTLEESPLRTADLITFPATSSECSSKSTSQEGLQSLIRELQHTHEPLPRLYGNDLGKSHHELTRQNASQLAQLGTIPSHDSLRLYRDECSRRKDLMFSELSEALTPTQGAEKVLDIAGLWPQITPRSVLRQLARNRIGSLPDQWKRVITRYAITILKYQQSQRLLELAFWRKNEAFFRETKTICEDMAAESTHDWLLIQIEANVLARPVQLSIAREMIAPSSKRSISLQLNMGEGKSSVIIPLVASTLANGSNLTRVVTPKPLSNQMFELLVSRLSGLANRPIFYVPFSRSLHLDTSLIRNISNLYRRCVDEGGVLVVQPEHILSQKLTRINFLLTSHSNCEKLSIANDLGVLGDWVAKVSRDVLDESDEILHVRYQLVYTAGKQMPIDDHPNRWVTTQEVLDRLKVHAKRLRSRYMRTLEFNQTQRGFPTIRILDRAVSQKISSLIIDDALGGALSTLPLAVLSPPIREAIRRFVIWKHVTDEDRELIFSRCAGSSLWCGILLLRGLLMDGEGILGYVLEQRRWRVDYGLDPSRTLLAVPYRAKDVPSLRAEFGHPDVVIALTCLSYYYGGLSKDQMLQCFDLLAKLDDPDKEYNQWVESEEDLPATLRQLNGVNTKDETVVDELLVPLFSRNTRVVDFYLSRVVFPRSAREFPYKLPTSAWDLVEEEENITTGFSGTNDNRYLLPTSITQEDPVSELGTNALVLQYLLQPENDFYECTGGSHGEQESAGAFLQRLVKKDPEIRVLLDVGAQMLELQNEDLARHWLSLRPDVLAAIFFNDSDHLTVLTQNGSLEPFVSSPCNRQLEKCVVYLDDAHTRGTDLKLPPGTRAAVTLGPKVTKDRLMQGCMRMRQLGKGHSVMFFAPAEVDRCIRGLIPSGEASGSSGSQIRVLDVLRWAMHETCEDISRQLPHWAQQGLDHHKRFYRHTNTALRDAWMQGESRTLEQTYDPISRARGAGAILEMNDIPALRERIEQLAAIKSVDVRIAEEQEREVNHEMEIERQVEQPVKATPAQDIIHEDIRTFVKTGMDKVLGLAARWSPSPLATAGFVTTTTNSAGANLTDYLRPVNWILSSGSGKYSTVIVISPHEANELLPVIRKSKEVRLHIYAPRVAASMRSFSDLTFYSIPESAADTWTAPPHVRTLLNLFAGQLYFDSREEYERVCIEVDGFVLPAHRTGEDSPFTTSAISTFKQLTGTEEERNGIRRDGSRSCFERSSFGKRPI